MFCVHLTWLKFYFFFVLANVKVENEDERKQKVPVKISERNVMLLNNLNMAFSRKIIDLKVMSFYSKVVFYLLLISYV